MKMGLFRGIKIIPLIVSVISLCILIFFSVTSLFFYREAEGYVTKYAQLISVALLLFAITFLMNLLFFIQSIKGLVADNNALMASTENVNQKFSKQYLYSYVTSNISQMMEFDNSTLEYLFLSYEKKIGMALVLIDHITLFRKYSQQKRNELYLNSIAVLSHLSETITIQAFIDEERLLLLWQAEDESIFEALIYRKQKEIIAEFQISVTVVYTKACYSVEELPQIYPLLCQETANRLFHEYGSLWEADMERKEILVIDEIMQESFAEQLNNLSAKLEAGELKDEYAFGNLLHEQRINWLQYSSALAMMRGKLEQCRLLLISKQKINPDIAFPADIADYEKAEEIEDQINQIVKLILNQIAMAGVQRTRFYIRQVEHLINIHYSDSTFGVQQIAEEMGLSSGYIGKLYKNNTGISILERLKRVRYEKVLEFLEEGKVPLSEVHKHCGYSSVNYFYHIFKSMTGMTPKQYQNATAEQRQSAREKGFS